MVSTQTIGWLRDHTEGIFRGKALPILAGLLLGLLLLLPGCVAGAGYISDPFAYRNLAFLAAQRNEPRLTDMQIAGTSYRLSDHLGYDTLLQVIARTTGLDSADLIFVALGQVAVPLLYYALGRTLLQSHTLAGLLALYAAYDPTMGLTQYSTHIYSWTHTLFLTAALIYAKILVDKRTWSRVALLFALFVAAFLVNWTVPVWLILLVGTGTIIARLRGEALQQGKLPSLVMAFVVLYFTFSQVFYHDILGAFKAGRAQEAVPLLVGEIVSILGLGRGEIEATNFLVPPTGSLFWDIARLLRTVILFAAFALPASILVYRAARARSLASLGGGHTTWAWALAVAGFGACVAYTSYGHISIRLIVFIFPIVILVLAREARLHPRYSLSIAGLFAFLAIVQFGAAMSILLPSAPSRQEVAIAPSAEYVRQIGGHRPLSDLGTLGVYLLESGRRGETFLPCYYTAPRYAAIVAYTQQTERGDGINDCDTLIINERAASLPAASVSWRYYEPLSMHRTEIEANMLLERVYDDGVSTVYRIVKDPHE
jgi:hypothetical protein